MNPKIHFEYLIMKEMEETNGEFYILSCFERQFKINRLAYNIIMLMDGTRNFQEISEQLNGEKNTQEIEEIYNGQFFEMGIVEGCVPVEKNKKRLLYWKLKLIDTSRFNSFNLFDFLFQKNMYILFGILYFFILFFGGNIFSAKLLDFEFKNSNILHLIVCVILVYFSGLFHELGHCLCSRKFCPLEKGSIGIAIYMISPVWYTDLDSVWWLEKKKKIQINCAGVYVQCIYLTIIMALALVLSDEFLFLIAAGVSISSFLNFIPFMKFDGYWILVDYFDFPNLLNYTIQTLLSKFKINKNLNLRNLSKKQKHFFNVYSFGFMVYIILFAIFTFWNLVQSLIKIRILVGEQTITLYSFFLIIRVIFSIFLIIKAITIIKENIYAMSKN